MSIESDIKELTAAVKELTAVLRSQGSNQFVTSEAITTTPGEVLVLSSNDRMIASDGEVVETPKSVTTTVEPVATTTSVASVAEDSPSKELAYQDVRDALMAYNKAKGTEALKALLAELGVELVPHIKPEQYARAIELAKVA